MRIPAIRGIIDRRVLVNFRIDPDVLSRVLPAPFRPQLVKGYGIAGICLIRLRSIRPKFLPAFTGINSENAAHRIAVEWNEGDIVRSGVFVPRRDTSSMLNAFAGGRIFPGVHHLARFDVREVGKEYHIEMRSNDGSALVRVGARTATELPPDSVFTSLADVSAFFKTGSMGYSPAAKTGQFDGLELRAFHWHVEPMHVTVVESSFFEDRAMFPEGSVALDNALVMRDISHEWYSLNSLRAEAC